MTKLLLYMLLFAPVALLTTSCSNSGSTAKETSFDTTGLRKTIDEKNKEFSKSLTSGDSAGVISHYTTDGKIFAPNADAVVGHAAMGPLVSEYLKAGIKEFTDQTTALYGTEAALIEEGTYFMGDGKGGTIDKGKYVTIWKKEAGDWKIYTDIFNTSLPEPKK